MQPGQLVGLGVEPGSLCSALAPPGGMRIRVGKGLVRGQGCNLKWTTRTLLCGAQSPGKDSDIKQGLLL